MSTRIKTSSQHRSGSTASVRAWVMRCATTGRFLSATASAAPALLRKPHPVTYSPAMVARIRRLAGAPASGEPMNGQDYLNWLNG